MDAHATKIPRRPIIASTILTIGCVAYTLLCGPAIGQRGFPPIDHVWIAVTYLWVPPIALSAIFDSGAFLSRRLALVAYALTTGFVAAATEVNSVPRHVTPEGTLLMTVLFYGPVHAVIAFLMDWTVQKLLTPWRSFASSSETSPRLPRLSLIELLVGNLIIALAIGFPFSYRHWMLESEHARGRLRATQDWAEKRALCYTDRGAHLEQTMPNGIYVSDEYDRKYGLRLHHRSHQSKGTVGYCERIAELLLHGIPEWSMKRYLLPPEELIALLDSSAGEEIRSLPFEINDNITIFRSGTISKWGMTITIDANGTSMTSAGSGHGGIASTGDEIAIATRVEGLVQAGRGTHRIFLIDHSNDTICIRYGNNWVGLFHRDGQMLQTAWRW